MAEGAIHKHLKYLGLWFLKEKVTDVVVNEVEFNNIKSIADVVGLNFKRKEVRVVECKATHQDFVRDKKLFMDKYSYFGHAHYSYILCPTDVIKPEELPHGYGLLYADEFDNVTLIKKPIKNTKALKTRFDTTLRLACKRQTNELLYSEHKENKDETDGKYNRNADVILIAVRCPHCKKTVRELISKSSTVEVKCSKCKEQINVTKAKLREITGFNSTFIKKLNSLLPK